MTWMQILENAGMVSGIIGAILMASKTRASKWAYPVWLLSSISLTLFAAIGQYYSLMLLQAVFTGINGYGIWRWVLRPGAAPASS